MSAMGFPSAGAALNAMATARPGIGGYVYTYADCGVWHWCTDDSVGARVILASDGDKKLRYHRINPDATSAAA